MTLSLVVLALACITASCASARGTGTQTPAPPTPLSLYPLHAGSAWSYDVDSGDGETTLAITKVEERVGPVVSVRTAGGPVVQYEIRQQGIVRIADRSWLLRAPFEPGQSWMGRSGRTVTISRAGHTVETPAGTFEQCVEVSEDGGATGVDVVTVYCVGVGPVLVRSVMRSNVRNKSVYVEAVLRGYIVGDQTQSGP